MTNNGCDKEKPNSRPRQVTPDSFNASANKPRWHEEASLSFDFDNKPAAKPAEPVKPAAPQKQYGLPEEPVRPVYKETAGEAKPESEVNAGEQDLKAKASAFASEKKDAAKAFMKKKMAAIRAASEAARSEAADKRREKAREEAIRAKLKAEAERMAGDAAAEADHQARLDEAVMAKLAAAKKKVKAGKKPKSVTKKKSSSGPSMPGLKKSAKKGTKKGGKKRGKYRWILSAFEIMLALMIICGVIGGVYAAITIAKAPEINPNQIYNTLDVSTHIYDDKGNLTDDIYYEENREIVKYEQLPENLKNAFIAIEDKTFWTHKGFNVKRIFGAILSSLRGGGEISGTSTITQQLARNIFLPEEKSIRSIKRKIIEMYYAHVIEDTLSKEDILTAYLNTIYLGYGCYGVDTAAKKYFDVSVEDLSLEQCAALAALPQAPGLYALLMTEPDEAETTTDLGDGLWANDVSRDRRYIVLDLMAEQGYITQEEADASKRPLEEFIKPGGASSSTNSAFKDYLLETVKQDLMTKYNLDDKQAANLIYSKGLNIYSTLDSQAQKAINKQFKNSDNFPGTVTGEGKVEAAMVIVEVGTGQIKAMVGTRKAEGEKLFNRATSPRQPGSSIKPLAVYSAALQKSFELQQEGKKFKYTTSEYKDKQGAKYWGDYITTASGVVDEKMKVNGQVWPKNYERSYSGYKTFRQAIQLSKNTCAVKILAQVGVDYSLDLVKKYGISTIVDDTSQSYNDINLAALALGAMTEGVTPLDMALAYATFPNGGVHNSGICYTKVTDSEGKVLLEGQSTETRVLDEGVAFIMTDVLQSVVSNGIATDAAVEGEHVGGKTGTTDDTWDIWFDGFTANYAAALWIGTDDNVALNTTSMTAAKLWSKVMSKVKRAKGGEYKSMPGNVIVKNGEYFTTGTQPPDPPPEEKKDDKDKAKDKADHSSTQEPDPNAEDNSGKTDGDG
ncbi:MAG: transglycosylase domain-containing protein [Mogibacterium sp.]|nr:transglycosylase domain-containing protein [Mogibacterium sp.]